MPYTQTTRAQLEAIIQQALQDTGVYWDATELDAAINEALLYWGALTSYWSDRGVFNTTVNTPFYDLSVQLPNLRSRSITFDQIVKEIQFALLEPATGVSGASATGQFSIGAITSAVIRTRNQFALDTRLPMVFQDYTLTTPPPNGRMELDQSVELITRAAWKSTPTGITTILRRQDEWASDALNYNWSSDNSIPYAFSDILTKPIEIQFINPPAANGVLRLMYINSTSPTVAANTTFNIPDEYYMALKYGAMYSLLSTDNEGYDEFRAKYCSERYKQVVQAAANMHSLLRVTVNGRRTALDTIWNLDCTRPFWMSQTGSPDFAGYLYDILALAPVAQAGNYSVSCDVVRSAPLPTSGSDFIQIGKEELPYIIDYCRHVLCFKMGGAEFQSTFGLYDTFLAATADRNKISNVQAKFLSPMFDTGKREQDVQPAA